jgi:hypothetical protein
LGASGGRRGARPSAALADHPQDVVARAQAEAIRARSDQPGRRGAGALVAPARVASRAAPGGEQGAAGWSMVAARSSRRGTRGWPPAPSQAPRGRRARRAGAAGYEENAGDRGRHTAWGVVGEPAEEARHAEQPGLSQPGDEREGGGQSGHERQDGGRRNANWIQDHSRWRQGEPPVAGRLPQSAARGGLAPGSRSRVWAGRGAVVQLHAGLRR